MREKKKKQQIIHRNDNMRKARDSFPARPSNGMQVEKQLNRGNTGIISNIVEYY